MVYQRAIAHAFERRRSVKAGHHDIHEYQIRPQLIRQIDRLFTRTRGMYVKTGDQTKRGLYHLANVRIIVNIQNGLTLSHWRNHPGLLDS
jgi:hypothetical protein